MGVSVSVIQQAGKVRQYGIPELEQAVMADRATLASAYWLAMKAAPEDQRQALTEAAGSKTALSHRVAKLRREFENPSSHRCVCQTCGRSL